MKELVDFLTENKLLLNDRFNYNRYWDWTMSVTEILSVIHDENFELIKARHAWALKNACDRWTSIHKNIEEWNHCSGNKLHDAFYLRFKEAQIIEGIDILQKEKRFVIEGISGTIDAITNLWVVDYKTSLNLNPKYFIQIAAYCRLSWETKWYLLLLNDKKYNFVKVDVEKYIVIWKQLLEYIKQDSILKININEDGNKFKE